MRKIKILTKGPIKPMNMCHGPILTPWAVSEERIRVFLKAGLHVVEVKPNGEEKQLTLADVMINGEKAPDVKPVEAPKVEKPVETKVPVAEPAEVKYEEPVEEADEVAEESEEDADDVAPETKPQYNNNHKKNKHKH